MAAHPQLRQGRRLAPNAMDLLERIFDLRLLHHARWLGAEPPFNSELFEWNGERFYHVSGTDRAGRRVLIEVFKFHDEDNLEAVLAFQYPPPIRDLYPAEYALLYEDDPWDGAFPPKSL